MFNSTWQRVSSSRQGSISTWGRWWHGPLYRGTPIRLGHGGVGGDVRLTDRGVGRHVSVCLRLGSCQVISRVVVEAVEISKGTLKSEYV